MIKPPTKLPREWKARDGILPTLACVLSFHVLFFTDFYAAFNYYHVWWVWPLLISTLPLLAISFAMSCIYIMIMLELLTRD